MTRTLHALAIGALAIGALASAGCRREPALGPVAPTVIPATFAVRMHRVHRAGDRGVVSTVVHTRRTTVTEEGGQVVKRDEDHLDVELNAVESVLRVDATGEPLDLEYTVTSLILQTPAGRKEVLPPGQVVTAARGADKVTFHAAEALSPDALRALDQILSPHASEATDDEVFGTRERQAIGAIWPMNAKLAARELGAAHLQVPADGIRGETRLVGLAQAAGQTCLDVAGELSIVDARLADVPGATVELRSTFRKLLPVDAAAPEIDTTATINTIVTAGPDREAGETRRDEAGKKVTTTSHNEKRRRFTPLR